MIPYGKELYLWDFNFVMGQQWTLQPSLEYRKCMHSPYMGWWDHTPEWIEYLEPTLQKWVFQDLASWVENHQTLDSLSVAAGTMHIANRCWRTRELKSEALKEGCFRTTWALSEHVIIDWVIYQGGCESMSNWCIESPLKFINVVLPFAHHGPLEEIQVFLTGFLPMFSPCNLLYLLLPNHPIPKPFHFLT